MKFTIIINNLRNLALNLFYYNTNYSIIEKSVNFLFSKEFGSKVLWCVGLGPFLKIKPPTEVPKPPLTTASNSTAPSSTQQNFSSPTNVIPTSTTANLPTPVKNSTSTSFYKKEDYSSLAEKYSLEKKTTLVNANSTNQEVALAKNGVKNDEMLQQIFSSHDNCLLLPKSDCMPIGVSHELNVQACITGAFILCLQQGMAIEQAVLSATFLLHKPGVNFTVLQTIGACAFFKKSINMLPYLSTNTLTPEILNKIANLKLVDVMFFFECAIVSEVNRDLPISPFSIFDPKIHKITSSVQNLTNNSSPDFIREFISPMDKIISQTYDQKAIGHRLFEMNHVRPVVSNNALTMLEAAKKLLSESVINWTDSVQQSYDPISEKEQNLAKEVLAVISLANDIKSYNAIRTSYDFFLTRNNIAMNLLTPFGPNEVKLESSAAQLFKKQFLHLKYDPNSVWYHFLQQKLKALNGPILKEGSILQNFRDYLLKKPL